MIQHEGLIACLAVGRASLHQQSTLPAANPAFSAACGPSQLPRAWVSVATHGDSRAASLLREAFARLRRLGDLDHTVHVELG